MINKIGGKGGNTVDMEDDFQGEGPDNEMAQMKQLFTDTNPYLLLLTLSVSTLHLFFDILAFKSDINFWKKRKTFEGLSTTTLIFSFVSQGIILLYLIDNDSSWLILVSSVFSLILSFWKLLRIFHVSIIMPKSINWPFPRIIIGLPTAQEAGTKQLDSKALKYLTLLFAPLVFGSSLYSVYYKAHKSWYSWTLSSFASAMYVGGFIMMTPQLFINYKLKSVSHLPWRALVYKALNTFIDDLFAFIIVMPTMHRLAVFRDDIIFFIYLYQRWIYPVDKTRVVVGMDDDD